MKTLTSISILFAASALFAQEITYDKVISENTTQSALQGNTLVESGATLTIDGNNSTNWSLKIESGAALEFIANDAFKWGAGSGSADNTIENYGSINLAAGKEFRFGDSDSLNANTTVNLYNGSTLSVIGGEGVFNMSNYRGGETTINIYEGASISNLGTLTTWDRNNSKAEKQKFTVNVNGGSFSLNTMNFGSLGRSDDKVTYSEINVTNGGQMSTTGNIDAGKQVSSSDAINISGENSAWNIVNTTNAAFIRIGNGAGTASVTASDGATINMNGASDINLNIGTNEFSTASFTVTSGATYQQGSGAKNTQLYMGNGTSSLEISDGAKWFANTNFYVGSGSSANATMTLDNAKIANSAGTGYSSDLNIASASGATGSVVVSNGGTALLRSFKMAQGGANANASLLIKGSGSLVRAMNTNNSNYLFILGKNQGDIDNEGNDLYEGNVAYVEIHTGAQLANTSDGTAFINDSANMKFVLDSTNADDTSVAMFTSKQVEITRTDDSSSGPFEIDGSKLKSNLKYQKGDEVTFVLMSVETMTFNGSEVDFLDFNDNQAVKESLFVISHNENLDSWFDFGYDELSHDDGNIILTLTYVPEPSTYAMVFAGLALAFAIYRRRR